MFSLKIQQYNLKTSTSLDEDELVKKAQKNVNDFKPLYELHYKSIYVYFYRRCANIDDCLDLTSKLFEKAMMNINKFKPMGFAFKNWLFKLAHNILIDYYRDNSKTEKLWVNDSGLENIADDLESENEKEERIQQILESLKNLEQDERNLIVMKYFEKMSYEELAEIENTTANNMRVKLHRIINKIKIQIIK